MAKKVEAVASNLNLEAELQNNSKYRSFSNDVIANLQTFDKAKEWADLINCMQKLQKTFSKYPQFPIIPSKLTFCKRMAQCLNPALPGGVHLRALQTFQSTFERIGPERLAADFAIYTMGIFPLFQYAAINVKPVILDIFENHFIPLGPSLIPSLTGMVISLLPGLEEESSEFYDKVGKILDLLCRKTNPAIFYRAVWKAITSAAHIRTPALNYLNSRIPAQKTPETIPLVLPEVQTLVVKALIAGVSDSILLTQRSCMELIINHFKIEDNVIENWEDLAVKVLYLLNRKEIALNRRLYQWFLGSNNDVFERNGKKVIVSALKNLFTTPPITLQKASDPFKIMTSLLDKQELGENIIDNVLPYIFYSVHKFKDGFPFSRELKQNANKFLDILQPSIIWNAAINLWYDRIREPEGEIIGVIDTLIDLQKCDEETQTHHLPNMLSTMIVALEIIAEEGNFKKLQSCLQLARKVFGKLSALATKSSDNLRELTKVISSYQNAYTNLARKFLLPFLSSDDNNGFNYNSNSNNNISDDVEQRTLVLVNATQLLSSLLVHLPSGVVFDINDDKEISYDRIPDWLETLQRCCQLNHPIASCCALKTVVDLLTQPNLALNTQSQQYIMHQTQYSHRVILRLWEFLHPSLSSLHFTVAKSLLQLLDYSNKFVCEILGKELLHKEPIKRVESCRKFSILWTLICDMTSNYNVNPLSRNAFLMLDCLSDEQPMVKHAGSSWLVSSMPKSIERILEPLLEVLLESTIERQNYAYRNPYDTRRVLYVLHLLKDIVECDPKLFLLHSIDRQVGKKILMLNEIQEELHLKSTPNYSIILDPTYYLELIIVTVTRFLQTFTGETDNYEFNGENKVVQSTATSLLRSILIHLADHSSNNTSSHNINLSQAPSTSASHGSFLREICFKLQIPILQTLHMAVDKYDVVLQVQLLRLLQTMIIYQHKPELPSEPVSLESVSNPNLKNNKRSSVISPITTSVWDSPIFLQAVRKGLSQPDPSSILPYWMEFLTSTLSFSTDSYAKTIPSLLHFFCDCLNHFQNVYTTEISNNVMILLKSLKIVLSSCLDKDEKELQALNAQSSSSSSISSVSSASAPNVAEGKGFFSSFMNVFSSEDGSAVSVSPIIEARGEILKNLPYTLHSLLHIWTPPSLTPQSYLGTLDDNSSNNKYFLQDQVVQIVDYILKSFPNELIYAVSVIWQDRKPNSVNIVNNNADFDISKSIMELLNSLDSISPSVVFKSISTLISNIIKRKLKDAKQNEAHLIHETTLLDFVNRYILDARVAPADLSKAWVDLVVLLRESMTSRSPAALLLLFRILYNFVAKSTPLEEKKQRKEQQDITVKLIDLCLKACDSSIARGLPEESKDRERIEALSLKATQLLSSMVPTMFDKIFDDKERAVTLMPSLLANIKDHSEKRLPWAYSAVSYLSNLQKNGCALTAWKKEVLNLFYDNSFFLFDFKAISEWKKIIIDISKNDKTFFTDLLGRVSKSLTSQPSMMFVSKEQENLMRSRNIKRIAFVLYAGDLDQWSNYLTLIQEILVDALKLPNAHTVYEQVFLCLRVMLIRMSHKKLTSFWPVILAEMMRIYGYGGKIAFDPNLVLSACKFLDMALIVSTEQFRLYEWIFVKDFPDSISISPSSPSLVNNNNNQNDHFSDLLRNSPLPFHIPFVDQLSIKSSVDCPVKLNRGGGKGTLRQPLILARQVDTIENLCSYLRNYSKTVYETSLFQSEKYSDLIVDRVIESDLIEYTVIKDFDGTPEKTIQQQVQLDLLHLETKPQFDTLDKLETETTNEENELEVNIINISESNPNLSNNNVSNNILIDNSNGNSNSNIQSDQLFPSISPSDVNNQFFFKTE